MSDAALAELKRLVEANPDNLEIRASLYLALVREGQADQLGIEIAADCGDPAAAQCIRTGEDLKSMPVYDDDLALLTNLPIEKLDLLGQPITDGGLIHLHEIPLKSLSLGRFDEGIHGGYRGITDHGLELVKDLPLNELVLVNLRPVTSEGLRNLRHMPLRKLALNEFSDHVLNGLEALRHLPLEHLSLDGCWLDDGQISILQGFRLKSLSMVDSGLSREEYEYLSGLRIEQLIV